MAPFLDLSSWERFHPIFESWNENDPRERETKTWLLHLRKVNAQRLGLFKNELYNLLKNDDKDDSNTPPGSLSPTPFPSKPYPLIYSLASVRPKMYSLQLCSSDDDPSQIVDTPDAMCIRRLKGLARRTVKAQIRHENYLQCLRTAIPQRHAMYNIRSFEHQLYITRTSKVSLSAFEDKRQWYSPLHSFAYRVSSDGHTLKRICFYEDADLGIDTSNTPNNNDFSQVETV